MSRDYTFAFGANPSTNTGLAPTFIFFVNSAGATISPPTISELIAGSGLYKANYNATQMISFILDGATTSLSSSDRYISGVFDPADKFASTLTGVGVTLGAMGATVAAMGATLAQVGTNTNGLGSTLSFLNTNTTNNATYIAQVGQTLVANGATISGIAATLSTMSSLLGSTQSSFGATNVDPLTVFGFLRRAQEIQEGNQVYTKATGLFALFSRGSGTTTLLRQFTVTDDTSTTTRE